MSKAGLDISDTLILWYLKNHRKLPWRATKDPYPVWLSEIILQQTRVDQGLPYYNRFLERFPDLEAFTQATEDEILKLWQGLGYYSRARNMMVTARQVAERHHGRFPKSYQELLNLKGIGPYTAAAIASFAFDQPHAVVDGNVIRVLARLIGIADDPSSAAGKIRFAEEAQKALNPKKPGLHNQAIMEFGSLLCRPVNPLCDDCPLQNHCAAYATGSVTSLPTKAKKTKVRERHFNYILAQYRGHTWIRKRPPGDIWAGLYELPLLETSAAVAPNRIARTSGWKTAFGMPGVSVSSHSAEVPHRLSHQLILGRLLEVRLDSKPPTKLFGECIHVKVKDIHEYPMARMMERLLEEKLTTW